MEKNYESAMLGGPDEPAIDPNGFYYIDFDKITRAEDIVAIMAAVNFSFVGNHPRIHLIAHLLDRENVQHPPAMPQPEVPKLKKIVLPKRGKGLKIPTPSPIPTPTPTPTPTNEDGGDVL